MGRSWFLLLVGSLDHVCGKKSKNNIWRPDTVNGAFTNGRTVDTYVVN